MNKIQNDIKKPIILAISCTLFIVGLVIIIFNIDSTYSESTSDYECSLYGYEVSASNGKYACCPSGYAYNSDSSECRKYFYGNDYGSQAAASKAASEECDSPHISGNSIYCTASVETANPKISSCYYCTGGSTTGSNYFWGSQPASSTCNGGSWKITTKTTESECVGKCYACYTDGKYEWSINKPTTSCSGGIGWSVVEGKNTESECFGKCYVCYTDKIYEWSIDIPTTSCSGGIGWSVDADITDASSCVASENTEPTCEFATERNCELEHGVDNCVKDSNGCWMEKEQELVCEFATERNCELEHGVDNCVKDSNGCWMEKEQELVCEFATERNCELEHGVDNCVKNSSGCWVEDVERRYTITYNANGGTGAPAAQTKTHGVDLKLSMTEPTRTGYTFLGWSSSSDAVGATYPAGDLFMNDGDYTLYAVWDPNIYSVGYDANGGMGSFPVQPKTHNVPLTLLSETPTRDGYTFLGWSESATATSATYKSEGTYTDNKDTTLYAVWRTNIYNINYSDNVVVSGNPNKGSFGDVVNIKNPTKTVEIIANKNKTDAVISGNITVDFKFEGWTSSTVDKNTALADDKSWDGNSKITSTKFKNLTSVDGATVTLNANFAATTVTMPEVSKEGYNCFWNTKSDGKGTSYDSKETVKDFTSDSLTFNLYAICKVSKTDEEPPYSPPTGNILITIVWIIGIGTLGYSVYYFKKRKNNV